MVGSFSNISYVCESRLSISGYRNEEVKGRHNTDVHNLKLHRYVVLFSILTATDYEEEGVGIGSSTHGTTTYPSVSIYVYRIAPHTYIPAVVFEGNLHNLWKSPPYWREKADSEEEQQIRLV